jgi:Transposase DNA-binding/Transposase DDE domain
MGNTWKVRDEYAGADFGDKRLVDRLTEMSSALGMMPNKSLPQALGTDAALEGAYRFLNNEEVTADGIVESHFRETALRCSGRTTVVIAHDTTDFVFSGEREGLGRMRGDTTKGFFAHTTLAVSLDNVRDPLGSLHLETWARGNEAKGTAKKSPKKRQSDGDRESLRWHRGVQAAEALLQPGQAIHVMDREADCYELLATMVQRGERFVVRSKSDRRVEQADRLSEIATQHRASRDVPISKRQGSVMPRTKKLHPPRGARIAQLHMRAATVTLLRPLSIGAVLPACLIVNVVVVEEHNVPVGEQPVFWRLLTTEPISTSADIERIIDCYRCRWRIEEFYKALKTGCAIEKSQLSSLRALVNLLAIYMPIAWNILRLRTLAQTQGESNATEMFSELQVRLLRHTSGHPSRTPFTIDHALAAIASLGGHLVRNGAPGWLILARGYERFENLTLGAILAEKM